MKHPLPSCLPAAAALTLALLAGCAHAPAFPEGTVKASGEAMPYWTVDSSRVCPADRACALGLASGAETVPLARRQARLDAYVQLSERAFPVRLAARFQSIRTHDDEQVRSEIVSELVGLMQGAALVREFWVERRVYTLDGFHPVFDAWVVVAAAPEVIERLHAEEVIRTRTQASELGHGVREAVKAMQATPPDPVSVVAALDLLGHVREQLPRMQEIPEKADLERETDRLQARLEALLQLAVTRTNRDPKDRSATVRVTITPAGTGIEGLGLRYRRYCGDRKEPSGGWTKTVTGTDGQVLVPLTSDASALPCRLEVVCDAVPDLVWSRPVALPWDCVVLHVNWRVSGYGTMLIGGKLQLRKEELAAIVEKRMPICRRNSPAAGRADLILDVTAELRYPIEVGHRTLMAMGNLTGGLRLRFGETELGSRSVHESILKAGGRQRREIQEAGVERIFQETIATLEKGMEALQGTGTVEGR